MGLIFVLSTTIHSLDMQSINIINCHIIHQLTNYHYIICHIIFHSTKL
jgi:hypothetical protein